MAKLGEVIRRFREQANLTQVDLAEAMGRTPQWVSALENDKIGAKQGVLQNLAKALGVRPEQIERMVSTSLLPLRAAEHAGIPIINKAPAGPAWDYEAHGVSSRDGHSYLTRLPGEESDDLFAVEVIGDSMEPELRAGDLLVLWPVPHGVPPASIDGRVVCVTFREESGGGVCLARMKFTGQSDPERGLSAQLVKDNPKYGSRDIWLSDLDRLAQGKRIQRAL